jgi:ferric-dicitrate binding protein FerR (iron transport regulator)
MEPIYTSAEELAMNPSFQQWVKTPDSTLDTFWQQWKQATPVNHDLVEKARELVLAASQHSDDISKAELQAIWQTVQMNTQQEGDPIPTSPGKETPVHKLYIWHNWQRIAAAITGILLIAGWIWWQLNQQIVEKTGYGQVLTVWLPDSSKVTLNGNSRLSYDPDWMSNGVREVKLQGEAFFNVRQQMTKQGKAKFLVHTSRLTVAVLGTSFDVSDRQQETRVVLASGKVRLDLARSKLTDNAPILMEPGDMVSLTKNSEIPIKQTVNPATYSSWKNYQLILNNTSLTEVAAMLENTYGFRVEFAKGVSTNQKLAGNIPTADIEVLLLTLAKATGLNIERNGNTIIFKTKQ